MPSIVAIANDSTALNLGLAGIRVEEMDDIRAIEKRCLEVLDEQPDVLILQEEFRGRFSERSQERLAQHQGAPLIVYCPAFEDEDADVDAYLSSIIRPAVGFEIRLG